MPRLLETLSCRSFWIALLAVSCFMGPISSVFADITPLGDISPADPSTWDETTTGYVGNTSAGTVTVDGGSDLLSSVTYVGCESMASGLVSVTGSSSTWTNSGDLDIGYYGSGTLSIGNRGTVTSTYSFLGYQADSTGSATVDGVSSLWAASRLNVGYYGSGTLSITNRGRGVSSGANYAGYGVG
jgi:fibronectin-binding autotransporter adhesin